MKNFPKLLILVFVLMTACGDDDKESTLSSQELLIKYNWIVFSVVLEEGIILEGEPVLMYHVLNFNETDYSGSDFTGEFYELGDWSLEGMC